MSQDSAERFDYIVLGAGSGGLGSAFRAARHGAKVALIERGVVGGTCVNVGCVPKKAMWYLAEAAEQIEMARQYGFDVHAGQVDWAHFVTEREAYIGRIHGSYDRRLAAADITRIGGHARLAGHGEVEVDDRRLHAPHILLATGGRAVHLDVPGAERAIDSDGFFALRAQPRRVALIGSGYIAVELAGVFAALGSEVAVIVRGPRLLSHFDEELGLVLSERLAEQGIRVLTGCPVAALEAAEDDATTIRLSGGEAVGPFDCVIQAIGRRPNSDDIGLEHTAVRTDAAGHVLVNEWQDSDEPGVHALGDLTGPIALTPVAIAQGRQLADRLFGGREDARFDPQMVPSVVFSHPPVATVGLSEAAAVECHGREAVKVYRSRFTPMQWSLAGRRESQTFMKMICVGPEERVIGLHLIGPGVDEMLQGFAVAIRMGARKADFDATVAIHPTSSEEVVLFS
ncbi:MAG: glutathione-disulfide reductase [Xanthomonadales bacterium]|nr:glutathione-disulfide reductase [Xanthomonadales bacterium]